MKRKRLKSLLKRSIKYATIIIAVLFVIVAVGVLARKWKKGTWAEHKGKTAKSKIAVGATITTALLAGGIGALIAGANALGGQAGERDKPTVYQKP